MMNSVGILSIPPLHCDLSQLSLVIDRMARSL